MDAGYKLLAAKYLRKQAKMLREQFEGVRAAEDIEFVHHARVASRRLRSGLKVFGECFKPAELKSWTKAIRRITAEMGDARDKDVQIEYLRAALRTIPKEECFAGISRLLVHFEYYREEMQRYVVKAINRLRSGGELKSLEKACKKIQARAASNHIDVQSRYSFARAEFHVAGRLEELLACEKCLSRSDDAPAHHVMRIAAKRLRYTLEIVRPIYAGRLDFALAIAKRVQTLLGEVHDCDVWQDQLDEFATEEHDRLCALYGHGQLFAKLDRGLQYLREDRRRRREQAFAELLVLWRQTKEQGLWEELTRAVRTRRNEVPHPPEAAAENFPEERAAETSAAATGEPPAAKPASKSNGNGSASARDAEAALNDPHFKPPRKKPRHHRKRAAVT
ncbi:MAG: CHAD domain-containing protein [Pirellulales bacterium]|nr:CHAD domain-containing protein [Pirellulales bacterium]